MPKESAVFFLMGQVYKKLGDRQKAMVHFTWAYDLDPKGSNLIKEAIDMNQPQFGEDEMDSSIHQE
jgi:anaphase-promoting complex subunit 3